MLAKADRRQHAGNLGYEDHPSFSYSWDDTVAHYDDPRPGDAIVIWDGATLIGASVVEKIIEGESEKTRLRCPECNTTSFKERQNKSPRYRCHEQKCKHEFDDPIKQVIRVRTYQTSHGAGWFDLAGRLDGAALRLLCKQPKSQQSLRPFHWIDFLESIGGAEKQNLESAITATGSSLTGGHAITKTRVRRGQAAFRRKLLNKFGSICAFTGLAPEQAIDAAHLYSYSHLGKHYDGGGILLRKDLHRLFDLGLIAIDPKSLILDLAPDIRDYSQYSNLHGASLTMNLPKRERKWVLIHWLEHRN